ncbi:MAG: hypothetical protein LBC02_10895 [Planctomycetaceae bacterium]|nr:hypothetical protein [Planctomycetaceae bacterium]
MIRRRIKKHLHFLLFHVFDVSVNWFIANWSITETQTVITKEITLNTIRYVMPCC